MTKAIALVVAASIGLAATGCTSGNKQAPQGTTPSSASVRAAPTGYHPVIDPANFQGLVDNPWFPLKPGSTAVYRGSKDGEPVREVYEVTHGVQKIMGVPCVVVHDQLFHSDGSLAEDTFDFYTQDRQGNVWYFGEMTVALDDKEKLNDTEGSWLAGEDGAQPGIFMEANPTVGHTF